MRNLRRALLATGLGFAVSFIASCGGGAGLLSGDQANTLNNQLNQISAGLSAGHCRAVHSAAQGLVQEVANLPSTVNASLRQDLSAGASTVSQLVATQCRQATTSTPTQQTTTSTTTATTTTTTPPTTTQTTATTPPTTTSTSPTTTTGPSGGGGLGGGTGLGGGGGQGGGGGGGTGTGTTGGGLPGGAGG